MTFLRTCAAILLFSAISANGGETVADGLQPTGEGLMAPPGFKIELIASEPMTNNPSAMAIAPDGRIFIADDYVHAKVPGKTRDIVKVLVGAEKGGPATKAIVLAEDLNSAQGLAYHDGKLYIAHSPKISVVSVSADNKAGPVEDLFVGFGLGKGVKPSHGAASLFVRENKLYLVIGDQGVDCVTKEGTQLKIDCGVVMRCNLDGTQLEVYAHGFRNTYGIAIDPRGNGFMRDNTNDGGGYNVRSYHVVKGGYYGWPFRWREGQSAKPPVDVLTMAQDNGGGSPTSAAWISTPLFPEAFNNAPYFCEWGKGTLLYVKPQPKGATYEMPEKVFMKDERKTGATHTFKPVAVAIAPDNSMIVADWGSSGLYPTVERGRILRVTYTGPKPEPVKAPAADALTITTPPEELLAKLTDADPLIRARAALLLGERRHTPAGDALVKLLADPEPTVRLQAATALGDLKNPAHTAILAKALVDEKERWVRHILYRGLRIGGDVDGIVSAIKAASGEAQIDLLHVLREAYDPKVVAVLAELSAPGGSAELRAKATEFLGLVARREKVRWAWGDKPFLAPSVRSESWEGTEVATKALHTHIRDKEPLVRNASIAALAALKDTTVVDTVLADLAAGTSTLDDATAIILARSAGNEKAVPTLGKYVSDGKGSEETRLELIQTLGLFKDPATLAVLRTVAFKGGAPAPSAEAINALGRVKDKESVGDLEKALAGGDPLIQRAAASALGQIGSVASKDQLLAAAGSTDRSLKAQALIALWRLKNPEIERDVIGRIIALPPAEDAMQLELAEAIGGSSKERAEPAMLYWLEKGTPGKATEEDILARLKKSKLDIKKGARAAVAKQAAEARQKKYAAWKAPESPAIAAADDEDEDVKFEKLAKKALAAGGDPAKGAAVFRNARGANCIACHAIRGEGGRAGPELTEVGSKYPRAFLIESVIYPSKQLLDGYEVSLLTLKSGERLSGIVQREDDLKVTLVKSDATPVTVPAGEIEKRLKSKNSLMPDGLANAMSEAEFIDLIAYLQTLKKAGE